MSCSNRRTKLPDFRILQIRPNTVHFSSHAQLGASTCGRTISNWLLQAGLEFSPVALSRGPPEVCKLARRCAQPALRSRSPFSISRLPNRLAHFINLYRQIAVLPQPIVD